MKNFQNSAKIMSYLANHECPAITSRRHKRAMQGGIDTPIVWKSALGLNVIDVDNNNYLDFTAGFGVMSLGYGHPKVIAAASKQLQQLSHTMGDAYCSDTKYDLFNTVLHYLPSYLTRILLGITGSDSIEAAIKTALLAKPQHQHLISYSGSYHGLSIGALSLSFYKDQFRDPFNKAINPHVIKSTFPDCAKCPYGKKVSHCKVECLAEVKEQFKQPIAAIFIEIIQGRGGIRMAPVKYMQELSRLTQKHGVLLIVDEIFTGAGRCGHMLLSEQYQIAPDMITLGKGLSGGVPISLMVAKEEVMNAWDDSQGEAIHTSTFLGNPLNCKMAQTTIQTLHEENIFKNVKMMSEYFFEKLFKLQKEHNLIIGEIRGMGLMIGVEILQGPQLAIRMCKSFLLKGIIVLPCGTENSILSITPPLIIQKDSIDEFICTFNEILEKLK